MKKTDVDRIFRVFYVFGYRLYLGFCFFFRPASRGAYAAVWHEGRILLIRNSYKSFVTVPGGGLKAKEEPSVAAARELREEVGIEIEPKALRRVGTFYSGYEFTRDAIALFEARLSEKPRVEVDRREVVWAGFQHPTEALRLKLFPVVKEYLQSRSGPNENRTSGVAVSGGFSGPEKQLMERIR